MAKQAGRNNMIKVLIIGLISVTEEYGFKKIKILQRIMDNIPAIKPNTVELFRIASTTFR